MDGDNVPVHAELEVPDGLGVDVGDLCELRVDKVDDLALRDDAHEVLPLHHRDPVRSSGGEDRANLRETVRSRVHRDERVPVGLPNDIPDGLVAELSIVDGHGVEIANAPLLLEHARREGNKVNHVEEGNPGLASVIPHGNGKNAVLREKLQGSVRLGIGIGR